MEKSGLGIKRWLLSRRDFVRGGQALAALFLPREMLAHWSVEPGTLNTPKRKIEQQRPVFRFFTKAEAESIEAFACRIIPGDLDNPGAREAGVARFIDFMLFETYRVEQETYREGLRRLNSSSYMLYQKSFVELKESEQDEFIGMMELGQVSEWNEAKYFFSKIRMHTIEGMFSDPKYQGNARGVGWSLFGRK